MSIKPAVSRQRFSLLSNFTLKSGTEELGNDMMSFGISLQTTPNRIFGWLFGIVDIP